MDDWRFQTTNLWCEVISFIRLPITWQSQIESIEGGKRDMDRELFEIGLAKRKETLGKDYVERNLEAADDFSRPFQEVLTEYCWGFGWGDETIDLKTRSMMNLTMLAGLDKMDEWGLHCRGALNNGVSKEEIRSIIHVIAIYCGVPQALQCFRVARAVLQEENML